MGAGTEEVNPDATLDRALAAVDKEFGATIMHLKQMVAIPSVTGSEGRVQVWAREKATS